VSLHWCQVSLQSILKWQPKHAFKLHCTSEACML
jgi:hypothetical protein